MSQRLPDYDKYRAREQQARSQQADRIGPDPQRNDHPDCYAGHIYTKWPSYDELKCYYCGRPEES